MSKQPLVTCLCLTMAGRQKFLERAIYCFKRQTYENKEMLIVADSIEDINGVDGSFEGICVLTAPGKQTIGKKRNLGCASAMGEYIAVWDDDDFSKQDRIKAQLVELQLSNQAVGGFRSLNFTDGFYTDGDNNWWRFTLGEGFVHGTSLLFKKSWWKQHPFPDINIGEDAAFCAEADAAGELLESGMDHLMWASIHPGNTSYKNLSAPQWQRITQPPMTIPSMKP